jgi:hypothetical protein
LLEAGVYSAITEELLECLLQFYAEKLTNELLKAVVPCHLREFKIDKCLPKLTFFGLTEVMTDTCITEVLSQSYYMHVC